MQTAGDIKYPVVEEALDKNNSTEINFLLKSITYDNILYYVKRNNTFACRSNNLFRRRL